MADRAWVFGGVGLLGVAGLVWLWAAAWQDYAVLFLQGAALSFLC